MLQIHVLSSVLRDQGIAPLNYFHLPQKHFHFETKAPNLESFFSIRPPLGWRPLKAPPANSRTYT